MLTIATRSTGAALRAAIDCVLPRSCVTCRAELRSAAAGEQSRWPELCGNCATVMVELIGRPYCQRCGRSMSPISIYEKSCARCEKEPSWNVRRIARVGPYEGPIRMGSLGMKHAGEPRAAALLGRCVGEALLRESWIDEVEWLVPVPMHRLRRVQRPIRHATVLARAVAAWINQQRRRERSLGQRRVTPPPRLRVVGAVRRTKYAPSQSELPSKQQRFENVVQSFEVKSPWPWLPGADVKGRTVCIIDNVLVSGATLIEVSKALRRAGAKSIYAAIFARGGQSAPRGL